MLFKMTICDRMNPPSARQTCDARQITNHNMVALVVILVPRQPTTVCKIILSQRDTVSKFYQFSNIIMTARSPDSGRLIFSCTKKWQKSRRSIEVLE